MPVDVHLAVAGKKRVGQIVFVLQHAGLHVGLRGRAQQVVRRAATPKVSADHEARAIEKGQGNGVVRPHERTLAKAINAEVQLDSWIRGGPEVYVARRAVNGATTGAFEDGVGPYGVHR